MFLDDDLDPKTKKAKPRDLSKLSVEELDAYTADLNAEIARVQSEKTKKQAARSAAAESLFKK